MLERQPILVAGSNVGTVVELRVVLDARSCSQACALAQGVGGANFMLFALCVD